MSTKLKEGFPFVSKFFYTNLFLKYNQKFENMV